MTARPIWCQPHDSQPEPDTRYEYGTRKYFKVVPVRQKDRRWIVTADHKAQAWAIAQFQRGHSIKLLQRCDTKKQAESMIRPMTRAAEGPTRGYRLGVRMGPKTV